MNEPGALLAMMAATIAAGVVASKRDWTNTYDRQQIADEAVDIAERILRRIQGVKP